MLSLIQSLGSSKITKSLKIHALQDKFCYFLPKKDFKILVYTLEWTKLSKVNVLSYEATDSKNFSLKIVFPKSKWLELQ